MKKSYTIIIILVVLAAGALLFFGAGKKAQAPDVGTPLTLNSNQANAISSESGQTAETSASEQPVKASPNAKTGTLKEFVVSGQNYSFAPNLITVKKGDKVKITFKNVNGYHNLIIDEFNVATKNIKGGTQDSVEFVADKAGSFQYYCSVGTHRAMGMWGTLKVE